MRRLPWPRRVIVGSAVSLLVVACVTGTGSSPRISPTSLPSGTRPMTVEPTAVATLSPAMTAERHGHTATLLADGRVLITGGIPGGLNGTDALASAELYGAQSNNFIAASDMTQGRVNHTATLLHDGQVLVAGGAAGYGADLASAELFDPRTGTFAAAGRMSSDRSDHTATLLADGRVLLVGGTGNPTRDNDGNVEFQTLSTAEIYDPTTGTFQVTGSMAAPRERHTATLLPDGRVLVAGGYDGTANLNSAEIYEPTTGLFTATGQMSRVRTDGQATLLQDGRVLITGGNTDTLAELYLPRTGRFLAIGSMTVARSHHSATLLRDGRVLIAGNYGPAGSAEIYEPGTNLFRTTGTLSEARASHTATLLPDGRVLLAGGWPHEEGGSRFLASAELYDALTGLFDPVGS